MVIVTDAWGYNDLRELKLSTYDFEVGDDENSFEITIRREEYENIDWYSFIYIPETEYGGRMERLEIDTESGLVKVGGYTWRGLLQKSFILPPYGQDYLTVSGDVNQIITDVISEYWRMFFVGADAPAGVTVRNYRFDRYTSVYDGLKKMLASVGMKLSIKHEYQDNNNVVRVEAVPIIDYSEEIEISSDMRVNYTMSESDGVDVVICLGAGELRNRIVRYIYSNGITATGEPDWWISTAWLERQSDIIAEVYDSPGAELDDLIEGGKQRFMELMAKKTIDVRLDTDLDVSVGDIIGGRDYMSGLAVKAPVIGKILKMQNGLEEIEYKMGEATEVAQ